MTDKPDEDAFEPNRVRISGETEADIVALSLGLGSETITIDTRTGTVSSEQLTLPYDRLESVHIVREGTYTVVFGTDRCEYAVTNLTADRAAVRELVDYARQQGGLRTERQSSDSTAQSRATDATEPDDGESEQEETPETELDEWTWGETSGTD